MTQPTDDLSALIGYRLKEAQSALRSRMDDALRSFGLTTPQYVCLELLSRTPGASNAELARGAFVTRQTMSTVLRGLQDRGLVERAATAPSGRALPTALTAEGNRLLALASGDIHALERRMISGLDDAQRAQLQTALTACIHALRP